MIIASLSAQWGFFVQGGDRCTVHPHRMPFLTEYIVLAFIWQFHYKGEEFYLM